jgi:hypothetical protein
MPLTRVFHSAAIFRITRLSNYPPTFRRSYLASAGVSQTSGSWLLASALGDQIDAAAHVFLERVSEALVSESAAASAASNSNSNSNDATKGSHESAAGAAFAKAPYSGGAAAKQ